MVDVPKFNFNSATIKSEAELQEALKGDSKFDKYFKPGRHEVQITGLEYKGQATDQNWGKFVVKVRGAGDKETTGMVFVPFKDVNYMTASGKPTLMFYKRFAAFMGAVGLDSSVDKLATTLNENFSKPEKSPLLGANVVMELGYDGNHVRYDGKDAAGIKKYVIEMKDKSTIAETFPSFDSAAGHAEQNGIKLQDYPQILSWSVSANAGATKKAAANW